MPTAEPFKVWADAAATAGAPRADARQQHVGLPVEQRQHLALQAQLAERHARQVLRCRSPAAGAAAATTADR